MKPYVLLGPHSDGKRQWKAGETIYLTDAQARWLWDRGGIAINGVTKPRPQIPALLQTKPPAPKRWCCG